MERTLVTGGAGFLGSHPGERLFYSLACPVSPVHYQPDPVQTIITDVHGAINSYKPSSQLEDGLRETISYFRKTPNG